MRKKIVSHGLRHPELKTVNRREEKSAVGATDGGKRRNSCRHVIAEEHPVTLATTTPCRSTPAESTLRRTFPGDPGHPLLKMETGSGSLASRCTDRAPGFPLHRKMSTDRLTSTNSEAHPTTSGKSITPERKMNNHAGLRSRGGAKSGISGGETAVHRWPARTSPGIETSRGLDQSTITTMRGKEPPDSLHRRTTIVGMEITKDAVGHSRGTIPVGR